MTFTGALVDVMAAIDGMTHLPTPGYSGAATITVDVSDQGATGAGGPLTDTDALAITLTPNPSAPSLDPVPPRTVAEGTALLFTATATDPDLPADTLTFSLVGAPAGASVDPGTGAFTWTPSESQGPGVFTFALVVTDGTAASDSESVSVTVTEVNAAPLVDPIADQSSGEGDAVSVQATATDPDLPAQAVTWSATGLPPGVTIDPSTGAMTGTITAGAVAGSPYAVTVTATDPDGAATSTAFSWSVSPSNSAPVLSPVPDATIDEQDPYTVVAAATDPEGQALRFELRQAPAGMTVDAATGRIRWTPSEAQGPDTYTVRVAVTDAGTPAMSAERTFTLKVAEVNRSPVLTAIPDQQARAGTAWGLTAEATDPDVPENLLRFSVEGPAGMTVDDAGVLAWTPSDADVGPHAVTLRVLDDGTPRRQDETTFTITVAAAGGGTPGPGPEPGGGVTPLPGPGAPDPGDGVDPLPPARPRPPATPAKPGKPARVTPTAPGSRLFPEFVALAPPVAPDSRVTVTLTAPLEALTAVAELDVPVQLLSMGGAWTFLVVCAARSAARTSWWTSRGAGCCASCRRPTPRRSCASCCARMPARCGRAGSRGDAAAADGWRSTRPWARATPTPHTCATPARTSRTRPAPTPGPRPRPR